jgi:uncharacterized protein YjiS (DUF1127 family)
MAGEEDPAMSHLRPTLLDAFVPPRPAPMSGLRVPKAGIPRPWRGALGRWLRRLRERDELSRLGERERRDAGITAYDVAFECRKLPWRD